MSTPSTMTLVTRRSKLALAQARAYVRELEGHHDGLRIEELHVVTSGDRFQDRPLQELGGKGLFIKEIEEALLGKRADIAVHSIKDIPAELAPRLRIAAIPKREDPRDVLVTRDGGGLDSLPQGASVGTSSLRRRTALLLKRPDLDVKPLRGNVDTRLRKLHEGQVDAIVLAYAGLQRLDMAEHASEVLSAEAMLPAVGQGALGIECRDDDERAREVLAATDDPDTRICVAGERAFMAAVGGNCQLPVAAYCVERDGKLWLRAMLAEEDGSKPRFGERLAERSTEAVIAAGKELGRALRSS